MNGWVVLLVLHLVGWGFCTLWVLGTCWKERMWGNAITWFNWWQAFLLSAILSGQASKAVVAMFGTASDDDKFTVIAVLTGIDWALFIAIFAGLKTWSEKLSRVQVAFHPVFDGIGNVVFCLMVAGSIAAKTLILLVLVGVGTAVRSGQVPEGGLNELNWLKGDGGGLPWQMATYFCGYWVAVAVAVAVLSRPSGRLDKPKKAGEA